MLDNFRAVQSLKLSKQGDPRYIILDKFNRVKDDHNGQGYTSKHSAYKGYAYKLKHKGLIRSKAIEKSMKEKAKNNEIKRFLKENPKVDDDIFNVEFTNKSLGYDIEEKDLKVIFKNNGLSFSKLFFNSKELLDYIRR
ncbi:hypothetical protein [Staphylococcus phage vB_StaM_SA1]|nr:hypothetical protein [Staphylococcus phage vB_StaM_SA1]